MDTAMYLEEQTRLGQPMAMGAVEVFESLDQLLRPLVDKLATTAAVPRDIADTYKNFFESMQVHNSVAGGIGGTIH